VDFQAIDGAPVHTLFTLVSPTVRAHLHLLSRLAFCLRDKHLRSILEEEAGRDVILEGFREVEAELPVRTEEARS
jgi:PTS system nitrogen regulatory IIA component